MANVTITIDRNDLSQIMEWLNDRMESFEFTARFIEEGYNPYDLIIENIDDPDEAQRVSDHYRHLIEHISRQIAP